MRESSATFVVRHATTGDLDWVMAVEQATAEASHWARAVYEKYVSEPRDQLFHRSLLVAVEGETVIGFVAGTFLEGDDAAVLESVVVDSRWRRRGVATALCAAIVEWAEVEGAYGVELEVRAANEAARSLYAGFDFVERGRRRDYYSNPADDAVLMLLKLRAASEG